jgi:TrmH family RNA methyltransferase
MKAITSAANPAFKAWLRLATQPRTARGQRRALAEGLHLAQAAFDAGMPVEAVLRRHGSRGAEIEAVCARAVGEGAAAYELAAALYDRLSPVERGAGVMLVLGLPSVALPSRSAGDLVYLDGVQDPGNVGTLLRTAAAAGVRNVYASPTTAAFWAPKTLRAGQGAHFRLRLIEHVDPPALADALSGPWFGADACGGEPLWTLPLPSGPVGWIFGAEGAGLSPAARAACRALVTVPIDSAVESLNVAAAAAVCLFERRRRLRPSP